MKRLQEYDFPEDLKNMPENELELLSYEIRDFLIEKVSRSGGHLASNLGVVELSIAIHRVFDSPKDKIIWDVGHQAYVHKILTGRADRFDSLRALDGLSGFPERLRAPTTCTIQAMPVLPYQLPQAMPQPGISPVKTER